MLKTDRLPAREEMQEHSKKAWEGYNLICEKMEREHWGEYITINPYPKDYFVGKNHSEPLDRARAAYPNTVFYTIRIGHKAVYRRKGRKLGMGLPRNTRVLLDCLNDAITVAFPSESIGDG